MRSVLPLWPLLLLIWAASAHAELYKWVGPDGKITYSDTPPPASAKRVESKSMGSSTTNSTGLPYALANAAKGNPVTLYTTANCPPCEEGRNLLAGRGVPFTEKTVTSNDDIAQLRHAGGDKQLPFLVVGRSTQEGFESDAWNKLLSTAGYPKSNRLPKSYRNPPPQSAAPASKTAGAEQEKPEDRLVEKAPKPDSHELPPALGNAPPGFRF
ncbi:MAG TPA: glutaredoxin family protein [Burkholderiaceae bacterium]|nr:glutaredoxin family protein [Burkholderiaceae bacterium]